MAGAKSASASGSDSAVGSGLTSASGFALWMWCALSGPEAVVTSPKVKQRGRGANLTLEPGAKVTRWGRRAMSGDGETWDQPQAMGTDCRSESRFWVGDLDNVTCSTHALTPGTNLGPWAWTADLKVLSRFFGRRPRQSHIFHTCSLEGIRGKRRHAIDNLVGYLDIDACHQA